MKSQTKPLGRRRLPPGKKREGGLTLKLRAEERARLDRAARKDDLEIYVWGRTRLLMVADYRSAGISLEVAYNAALKELSPAAAEKVREAVDSSKEKPE